MKSIEYSDITFFSKEVTIEEMKDEVYEEMNFYHNKDNKISFIKNDQKFKILKRLHRIPTLDLNGNITYNSTFTNFIYCVGVEENAPLIMEGIKKVSSVSSEQQSITEEKF